MIYDEWVFHDVEHIYLQLIKKIRCAIYSGQLSAGEKIPSVREMVKKREDTAKVLCFSYFDNMFALGFSKDEAIRFIQDYSERLKIQTNLG